MAISDEAKAITDRLYAAYGTDSGIIFGVTSRGAVEAIVQTTLDQTKMEQVAIVPTTYGKEYLYRIDGHLYYSRDELMVMASDLPAYLNHKLAMMTKHYHSFQRDCAGKRQAATNVEVLQKLVRRLE